jgi:hypothetical protein
MIGYEIDGDDSTLFAAEGGARSCNREVTNARRHKLITSHGRA